MSATATFTPFDSTAAGLSLGAEALLFVMAHGHAISVPDTALHFAEKVGVVSIARRDTPAAVLTDVNRALDIIATSLRQRARLDREQAQAFEQLVSVPPQNSDRRPGSGVTAAALRPQPIVPPAGVANPF